MATFCNVILQTIPSIDHLVAPTALTRDISTNIPIDTKKKPSFVAPNI